MGQIVQEVLSSHFADYPDEEFLLRPFVQNFDITWARKRRAFGSDLTIFFLSPEPHMERAFGFESEILAVYSSYEALQPRTIQAIEKFLSEEPARGRVDTMITFLISEADDPVSWVRQYMTSNPDSGLVAAFSAGTLRKQRGQSWLIRSVLAEQLYQRDLFDHRLPITNDFFFFGREELIFDLHNAFKRSENRGLFGLRKTGKTSVFFKLRRLIESTGDNLFIYVDCKFPPNRSLRWDDLLLRLANQLTRAAGTVGPQTDTHASDAFVAALKGISDTTKIAIVFDEIEYITPNSPLDAHWSQDFVPFWQTMWHAQSLFGNLAIFVGGVNPTVVEKDLIGDSQNPLFGIVPHQYLGGLSVDEIRRMLRSLGRPMGLRFSASAVDYIFDQYGGHPLLTRVACSIMHRILRDSGDQLPRTVSDEWLQQTEANREAELSFYCGHVVSELKFFYPEEYEILTEVANGNLADMYEFISDPTFTTHLDNYGLLRRNEARRPSISIPALERYVRLEDAHDKGIQTSDTIQPESERNNWLRNRIRAINDNLEQLQQVISKNGHPKLFGPHSYPESHKFFDLIIVSVESDFSAFINTCNRCFVEPIENYGRSIGNQQYFWRDIKNSYPELSEALRRIKVYRHHRVHIRLEPAVDDELRLFLERDLHRRSPAASPELWFQLQQCVLDNLLVGILVETDRLT